MRYYDYDKRVGYRTTEFRTWHGITVIIAVTLVILATLINIIAKLTG